MTTPAASRLFNPLRPRDPAEAHRVASPLELFTDLCFVVAISQAASSLHVHLSEGHGSRGIVGFAMVFFAIFWAWLNFSWFASAYDNDDVGYRLLTLLHVLGSLVLAAGIPGMVDGDFALGVLGYLIMRSSLVVQWLRVAGDDPPRRATARRYATGIVVVQLCWVCFIFLPHSLEVPAFSLGVVGELLVPAWAERAGITPWHPHHIAERYSLFYIIVLGETVLSTTVAIQQALTAHELHAGLISVIAGGVLIVFSIWWLYFSRNNGEALARVHDRYNHDTFFWGYGHYFLFASGAAIGAGLAVRVDVWRHNSASSHLETAFAVTVPVALVLATMWTICARLHDKSRQTSVAFGLAVLLVLAATVTPVPELAAGVVCAGLLAFELVKQPMSSAASQRPHH
ncbi:MAG TPA: low temperature requirement protein A [Acidothermaceae bacterium]|nr:low temperature requirement protein A [Acidothermaceae bacterium]